MISGSGNSHTPLQARWSSVAGVGVSAAGRPRLPIWLISLATWPEARLQHVWRVPQPVPPTSHGYKYRAVYSVNGVRVVGFDNERGKGDHCHLDGGERAYRFTTVEALVEDFIAAVDAARSKP